MNYCCYEIGVTSKSNVRVYCAWTVIQALCGILGGFPPGVQGLLPAQIPQRPAQRHSSLFAQADSPPCTDSDSDTINILSHSQTRSRLLGWERGQVCAVGSLAPQQELLKIYSAALLSLSPLQEKNMMFYCSPFQSEYQSVDCLRGFIMTGWYLLPVGLEFEVLRHVIIFFASSSAIGMAL
jgi:hypothetical protein